jgi:hypothetical protein
VVGLFSFIMNSCEEKQFRNIYVIAAFFISFLIFSIYAKYTDKMCEEDKAELKEKSEEYFQKHRRENEEFFLMN